MPSRNSTKDKPSLRTVKAAYHGIGANLRRGDMAKAQAHAQLLVKQLEALGLVPSGTYETIQRVPT